MIRCRRIGCAGLLIFVLACLTPPGARADTQTTTGDRSGEGSTTFTGLAQTPEATLYTGAASTRVMIEVPPGRKNLTPQLALTYTSSGGPGPFGYGWELPLGRIERSTKWGFPRCNDEYADDVVLSMPTGSFELRPVGGGTYRPRIEEGYLRAVKESDQSWTVWDRSGIKYRFGATAATRLVSTQACGSFPVAWALDAIEDPNGNTIRFTYISFLNVLYPHLIEYGGNPQQGLAHLFRVEFGYALRPDHRTSGRLGLNAYTASRLVKVSVHANNPPPGQPTLVRVYKLAYDEDLETTQSRLNQVAVYAVDDDEAEPLYPPQQFVYAPPAPVHAPSLPASLPSGFEDKGVRAEQDGQLRRTIMDMNGDALPDLVYAPQSGTGLEVHLGLGNGAFASAPIPWANPGRQQQNALRYIATTSDERIVTVDTIDLTGDGIPDYVVATPNLNPDCRWRVYPGRKADSGAGLGWRFDATPIWWQSPHDYLRIDAYTNNFSRTYHDLVDMNGDGRPDLVRGAKAPVPGPWTWDVYLNTGTGFDSDTATAPNCNGAGSGFEALTDAGPPAQWISATDINSNGTAGNVMTQLADFNGDGLPDYLRIEIVNNWDRYLTVHRNVAGRFDGVGVRSTFQGLAIRRWTDNATVEDLLDLDGDGLPDRVFLVAPPNGNSFDEAATWSVALNRGNVLDVPQAWSGITGPIRKQDSTYTRRDVVDLNGDGLLDRIGDFGASGWRVSFNQSATNALRPHLLTVSRNGVGGTHTLRYVPSTRFDNSGADGAPDLPSVTWVLRDLASGDGLEDPPPPGVDRFSRANPEIAEGHLQVTRYTYAGGYFDPVEREFLGFRDVWVSRRNDDSASSSLDNVTRTTFGQTTALRGRVLESKTYAGQDLAQGEGGAPVLVASQVNTWGTMALFTGRTRVYLQTATKTQFDLAGGSGFASVTEQQVDANTGNVLSTRSQNSANTEWIRTRTDYATPDSGSEVRDRPTRIWSDYKPLSGSSKVFLDKRFYYDGADPDGRTDGKVDRGNVKRTVSYVTSNGSSTVTSRNGYDAFGNITTVTDERGHVTTTVYDGVSLYPATIINALSDAVHMVTDQRWGKPSSVTDANGNTTITQYDAAGRVECVRRPLDGSTGCANASERFAYHYATGLGGDRYTSVAVSRVEPNHPDGYVTATQHYDGMGRPRYMTAPRVVQITGECADPAPAPVMVVSQDTEYDAAGRVAKVFSPYLGAFLTRNSGATTTDYRLNDQAAYRDPFGRPNRVTKPDGQSTRAIYEQARTSHIDEIGNKTLSLVDVFGRTARSETYDGQGATPYSYQDATYDGAGRVLTTRINGLTSSTITNTYDLLGRRLTMVDPSSGTWTYTYDATGNVVIEDDPRAAQYIKTCYDALNRPTKTFHATTTPEPECSAAADVTYTYGEQSYAVPGQPVLGNEGVGRLTAVDDTSGSTLYRYDARGRTVGMSREIVVNAIATRGSFTWDYDVADHLQQTKYPDNEIVRHVYDATGQSRRLYRLSGTTEQNIVSSVCYDHFGRTRALRHGNDVIDSFEYGTAATNHRLRRLRVAFAGASSSYLRLGYPEYDARGLLTRLEDERDSTAPLSNTLDPLQYDHLGRLLSASGPSVNETHAYDALGRITWKGPRQFNYSSTKPFQLVTTDPGGALEAVSHDLNGNRTGKQANAGDQTYLYDHEDRLTRIDVGASTVHFLYDYRGRKTAQVVEANPGLTTRYYSELSETTSDGYHMRFYFLDGVRVASRRTSSGSWQTAALQPSVQLAAAGSGPPALTLLVGRDAGWALSVGGAAVCAALLLAPPWRRRRGARRATGGRAVGTTLLTLVATLPWPLLLQPAPAAAQKGGGIEDRHYHQDHLGSVQVTSDGAGACKLQTRYTPYGDVRERRDCLSGAANAVGGAHRYEFTDYETEVVSELAYAGARFYDPALASFLTLDPAREFNSPYTYTNWNPTNLTDPTGACVLLGLDCGAWIAIGIAASAAASAIDTGVRTGDVGAAFKALGISLGVGLATAGLGAAAVGATVGISPTLDLAIKTAGLGSGLYGVGSSIESGSIAGAVVGGALLLLSVYGLATEAPQGANGRSLGSSSESPASDSQLAFVDGRYDPETGELTVTDVDTGVRVRTTAQSGGRPFGDPIEPGVYEILERGGNPDSFRLDAIDTAPRNDRHELSGRGTFRLHGPGRTTGCIACSNRADWAQIKNILNSTSTTTVPDRATPWWRRWTTGPETIRNYGTLTVD